MEAVVRLAAVCLIGAVLTSLLRRTVPGLSLLLTLAVCLAGAALLFEPLEAVRAFWQEAAAWGEIPVQLFVPLFKTLGIALVCRTGAELCRDAGEGAMASVLETVGAVAAVWVSLPLFEASWELLRSLL